MNSPSASLVTVVRNYLQSCSCTAYTSCELLFEGGVYFAQSFQLCGDYSRAVSIRRNITDGQTAKHNGSYKSIDCHVHSFLDRVHSLVPRSNFSPTPYGPIKKGGQFHWKSLGLIKQSGGNKLEYHITVKSLIAFLSQLSTLKLHLSNSTT